MTDIKFKLLTVMPKRDLEDLLADLGCLGVVKIEIEECEGGFVVTFDKEEWVNSWESVGFYEINYAQMFQEELEGQGYEAIVWRVD